MFKNLEPLAKSRRRSSLRYPVPASSKLHDPELDQKKVKHSKDVLSALAASTPNRLKKTGAYEAMEMLQNMFAKEWRMPDADKDSWCATMSLRCRIIYYKYIRARCRSPVPTFCVGDDDRPEAAARTS